MIIDNVGSAVAWVAASYDPGLKCRPTGPTGRGSVLLVSANGSLERVLTRVITRRDQVNE